MTTNLDLNSSTAARERSRGPAPLARHRLYMSSNDQNIYEEHVLDHYEDPYHRGPLDSATHSHEADNPLCGDVIHIDLKLNDRCLLYTSDAADDYFWV